MASEEQMDTRSASPMVVEQAEGSDKPTSALTTIQPMTPEPDSTTSSLVTLQPVQVQPVSVTTDYGQSQPTSVGMRSLLSGQVLTSLQSTKSEVTAPNLGPVQGGQISTTQVSGTSEPCKNKQIHCDNEMLLEHQVPSPQYTIVYACSPMSTDSTVGGIDDSPSQSPSTTQQDYDPRSPSTGKQDSIKCEPKFGCVKIEPGQCKASCSQPFLPPCKVCGDRASGFHYGVNTCEPCKGFFRRSIVKIEHHKETYKCAMSGKCALGPGTRHACSSCRYHKCIEVGMSKDAIKTGRYTYEKRTKITQEVKKLERMEKGCHDLDIKEEEAEHIIKELVAVQRRINPLLAEYYDGNFDALNEQAAVFEAYMRRIEMFGSMSVLPPEVYEEFYKETGIDVDNRQELMKHVVERMETCITNMVEYVRSVPELKELTLEDQTALVKASHFEFGFLCMYHGINTELNVVCTVSNEGECKALHKDEITKVIDKTFLDDLFQCAKTFKCLNLTEEEVALCRGIVITFRDRCVLQEPDRVEQIQWRLISCLRYYSRKRGLNPDHRFCQIFDRLTALRSVSEMCRKLDMEKAKWSAIKDHPLVLDVITS